MHDANYLPRWAAKDKKGIEFISGERLQCPDNEFLIDVAFPVSYSVNLAD